MKQVPSASSGQALRSTFGYAQDDDYSGSRVLQILHTGTGQIAYKINQADVARDEIRARLGTIFSTRSTKVLFIAGDEELDFGPIAGSIDLARRAGVDHVGLITHRTAENR